MSCISILHHINQKKYIYIYIYIYIYSSLVHISYGRVERNGRIQQLVVGPRMPSSLHWWEQYARELIWVWEILNRCTAGYWLENHSRLLRIREYADRNLLYSKAHRDYFVHTWAAWTLALSDIAHTWATGALIFSRRLHVHRQNLNYTWASLALLLSTRTNLAKIRLRKLHWLQYWARRRATAVGARAITKREALANFNQKYYH